MHCKKKEGKTEKMEEDAASAQAELEAASVNTVDKDGWCATALQPGRKTPRPLLSARCFPPCHVVISKRKKQNTNNLSLPPHTNCQDSLLFGGFLHHKQVHLKSSDNKGKMLRMLSAVTMAAVCISRWKALRGLNFYPSVFPNSQ